MATNSTPTLIGDEFDNPLTGSALMDVIAGLAGNDTLSGFGGDDELDGGSGNDLMLAGAGNDIIHGGAGDDRINGAGGIDTVCYEGSVNDYTISTTASGRTIVTSISAVPDAGRDFLRNVEQLYFAEDDYTLFLDGRNNKVLSRDDTLTTHEDSPVSFTTADLLANDQEFDGDRMRIVDFDETSTGGGTITRDGDSFTYDPGTAFQYLNSGETAVDTFTYRVGDGKGGSTVATVEVSVTGLNDFVIPAARINEFHYDNAGSDVGEFVEIRVATGSDPEGLLLELVNQNGEVYGSTDLSTITPITEGVWDYYVIDYPSNGIQNGGNDGMVLSYREQLIEFLSYEGTVTAFDSVAAYGVTSTDIGVSETSSTSEGFSLQRNDDGTWRAPGEETKGADNVPPLAQVIITEIMQNPSDVSDSDGEWFEIYNAGSAPVDINGWTISDEGSNSHVIDNGGPLMVAAGAYALLARSDESSSNGGLVPDYAYGSSITLGNSDDEVILTDTLGREVDRVEYDGGPDWPDPTGASMYLLNLGSDNNDGANWAETPDDPTFIYNTTDTGTPGAANPAAPDEVGVVINEIMQNPSAVSDSAGEWFELFNPTDSDIDINGWTIADNDSESHVIDNGGPLVLAAGGFLVLGIESDSTLNGGVEVDYQYSGLFLSNSSDELVLLDTEDTEIDRVEWDNGATFPDPTGASMSLNDPANDNSDGANWSEATATFGSGDSGTPGAANDAAGGGGGGTDPLDLAIFEVQGSGFASPYETMDVRVTGVVTYSVGNGFFMQDAVGDGDTGTSDGVFVFTGALPTVSLGDEVTVTGTVAEFFDETQISAATVEIVTTGNTIPSPAALELGPDSTDAMKEALEGMLIALTSATDDPITITTNFNFDRFGSIEVSAGNKYQPTQTIDPADQAAIDLAIEDNTNNTLTIDDGISSQNPTEFAYAPNDTSGDDGDGVLDSGDTFDATGATLRLGSEMTEAVNGVLRYQFSEYTMLVDGQLPIDPATNEGAREDAPAPVGGDIQLGAFNVLNYFTTLSGTTGPNNLSVRGASTAGDLDRQTDKLVEAMSASGVEVFAIQEVENNGFDSSSAIGTLAGALGADTGNTYAVVDPNGGTSPFIGTDAITTGIIYDTAAVSLVSSAAVVFDEPSAAATFDAAEALASELGISNSVSDNPRNRPAVVATFEDSETGTEFTVVSVHFKSKGPSGLNTLLDAAQAADAAGGLTTSQQAAVDAFLADPNVDQGDGQGFWNGVRSDAASQIYTFLTTEYTGSGVADWIVMGDYNAYSQEDPTQALAAPSDTVDLLDLYVGPDAYSFVFDGQRGALDQAVASSGLADMVTGLVEWHINADEPDLLNYSSRFNDPAFFSVDPFASSDHDPVIIGLEFDPLVVA